MIEKIRGIINNEASAIENIPITTNFREAIELIHRQVHGKSGNLVSRGMGKASQIAHNIAPTLSSTGTPAVFLHPRILHNF